MCIYSLSGFSCADIQQLSVEAQHRWLRPAEICEILRNYQKFRIASEPPTRPPSTIFFFSNVNTIGFQFAWKGSAE